MSATTTAQPLPLTELPWRVRFVVVAVTALGWLTLCGVAVALGAGAFHVHPIVGLGYVVVCAALAVLVAVQRRRESTRRRVLQDWAADHGWDYEPRSSVLVGRWSAAVFRGASRRAGDVLRTVVDGVPVVSFTHGGAWWRPARSVPSGIHVVMTSLPASFPGLAVQPEDRVSRLAEALGGQDVATESAAFNAHWQVTSIDPRFAHAIVHPRLMERLLAPDARGLGVVLEGRDVVVHAPGATPVDKVDARVQLLLDVVRLLPPHALADRPEVVRTTRVRSSGRRRPDDPTTPGAYAAAVLVLAVSAVLLVALAEAGAPGLAAGAGAALLVVVTALLLVPDHLARRRRRRSR